jgi:hypothetical protein
MKATLALCLVVALLVGFASDASSQVLVGRWQFEEGSGTNTVNSVNSVNAVLEGGASFGTLTDPFGGDNTVALGTGRYVDTMQGAPGLLPTTGSYSISAWGYITNEESLYWELVGAADNIPPTQGNSVINGYASASENLNLARGEVWGPNASPYVPTAWQGGIPVNAWNNFVLVNDSAAKTVTIFVNGVASVPSTYTNTPFTNPVGNWLFGGGDFFQGEIADVQFYTGTLSAAQINDAIMQGNAVTVNNTPVLVGRWQFTEGEGTNTVNSVNSVNAVLEGGASFGTLTDPFGGDNTVALGTGRYVDTMQGAPDLLPTTGSYSISAWGYITNAASENWTLVGAADNAGPTQGNSLIEGHAGLGLARATVFGPGYSPWVPTDWQGGIANNAWNNFVLVNDSAAKTVTIFVNGVASEPTAYSGTPFTNPVGAWIFGGNTFFQGEIADVQFYTGVLSPAQIKDVIMQGNAVATETNDYSGWLANYPSLTGANTNGTADPDGDGFVNNAEFSFGGDPTVGTPALMTVIRSGANAVFNWIERTNGVTYDLQRNGTLTNEWTPAAGAVISNSANQSGVLLAPTYVRKEFVTDATGKDFYRVQSATTGN